MGCTNNTLDIVVTLYKRARNQHLNSMVIKG